MIVVRSTSGLDNELSFVLQCFAVIDLSRDENFSSAAVQAIVRVKRAESRRARKVGRLDRGLGAFEFKPRPDAVLKERPREPCS